MVAGAEGLVMYEGNSNMAVLLERYNQYTIEVIALERKISLSPVRTPTREARLNILKTKLMPDLQRIIERGL